MCPNTSARTPNSFCSQADVFVNRFLQSERWVYHTTLSEKLRFLELHQPHTVTQQQNPDWSEVDVSDLANVFSCGSCYYHSDHVVMASDIPGALPTECMLVYTRVFILLCVCVCCASGSYRGGREQQRHLTLSSACTPATSTRRDGVDDHHTVRHEPSALQNIQRMDPHLARKL